MDVFMTPGLLTTLSGTRSLDSSNPSSCKWVKAEEAFNHIAHRG